MNKIFLSIVLPAAKEKIDIFKKCLGKLTWADEIIVIDNGISLEMKKLLLKVEAKIYPSGSPSFAERKNLGAQKATGIWLLFIDTDEVLEEALIKEIKSVIKNNSSKGAYEILRRNVFLGHEMKHGGWAPDYTLRLIKKENLIFWEGVLHEQPRIKGEIGKLKGSYFHFTHQNIEEMVEKTNKWSKVEAKLLFEAGHPPMAWWRFFSIAGREFWYRGIAKLGFLDGPIGIFEIGYQMYSRMITYAKLWELQVKAKNLKN
jgi:glycosyltransferase involved in cell wall biosynthesis